MLSTSLNRRGAVAFAITCFACFATITANALRSGIRSPTTFFSGDLHDIQDYLSWVETVDYKGAYYLASDGDMADGAAIHWNIDDDRGILELAVAVRATGWLGFGISDNGGMKGSDVLLFEAINPDNVTDAHIKDLRYPQIDDCQSWEFVRSSTDTDFLIVEVRRKLDTQDSQDWPIHNDADVEIPLSRIIVAWSDEPNVGYHGAKNARSTLRWYGFGKDELLHFQDTMEEKAVGSFMFVQHEYNIPPEETLYIRFCISADQMREQRVPINNGATIIGLEPIITTPWVHHYTLYGSPDEHNFGSCENAYGMDLLYSWAPGETPLTMPDGVGISVGGESGFKSFRIEYHYNNRALRDDLYDSSGIKFYYALDPPMHEVGLMQLGDPYVLIRDTLVGTGLTEHVFTCKAACSEKFLADSSVTVFRDMFHMHEVGLTMFSEHYRDGKVIRTSKAQFYDFEQQGGQILIQEPYEMKAGDYFRSGCFFRNDDPDRVFGIASTQEMCTNFLMYYPRKTVRGLAFSCGIGMGENGEHGVCASSYERVESLDDIKISFRKYRLFGQPGSTCAAADAAAPLALKDDKETVEILLEKNSTAVPLSLKEEKEVVVNVEIPLQNRTPPLAVQKEVEHVNTTTTAAPPPLAPPLQEEEGEEVEKVKIQVQNTTTTTST